MGKRLRHTDSATVIDAKTRTQQLSAVPKAVDPALAALFKSTFTLPTKSSTRAPAPREKAAEDRAASNEILSSGEDPDTDTNRSSHDESGGEVEPLRPFNAIRQLPISVNDSETPLKRKRRKGDEDDDIEGAYMQRLAQDEEKETTRLHQERLAKRPKLNGVANDENGSATEDGSSPGNSIGSDEEEKTDATPRDLGFSSPPPQHETTAPDPSIEQAARTVFLGNVSTSAIVSKTDHAVLLAHLSSHLSSLPESTPPHKISSFRFRSTPYADSSLPKKAAFAKKAVMDSTTKSTNAYVVYSTALAAREAVRKLNGTVVLERHLRVDGVAHPTATDHRRCVFVGNLGFVDDESAIKAAEDQEKGVEKPRKKKEPADVEEGLWRQFGKVGVVESVRVVRDKTTRVGKGFAYVQFKDSNAVEKALFYHKQSFPPLLPRNLRVVRAKNIAKTASYASKPTVINARKFATHGSDTYTAKPSSQSQSLSGRAGKLLGRAGAAKIRQSGAVTGGQVHGYGHGQSGVIGNGNGNGNGGGNPGVTKTPERIVFEGYRARGGQKPTGLQGKGGSGRKGGKPKTRSSKRAAAFKASGGKKKRA